MCSLHVDDAGEFCVSLSYFSTGKLPHLSSLCPCSEIIRLASLVYSRVWVNYKSDIYLVCTVPLAIEMQASGRIALPNTCVGSRVMTCRNPPCHCSVLMCAHFKPCPLKKTENCRHKIIVLSLRSDFFKREILVELVHLTNLYFSCLRKDLRASPELLYWNESPSVTLFYQVASKPFIVSSFDILRIHFLIICEFIFFGFCFRYS